MTLNEAVEEYEKTIDSNTEDDKVKRAVIAASIFAILNEFLEDEYTAAAVTMTNKQRIDLISDALARQRKVRRYVSRDKLIKQFKKDLKARTRSVNYRRMARRQANIIKNQVAKLGKEEALKKAAKRFKTIAQQEAATITDGAKGWTAKQVERVTDKTAYKRWQHGMYNSPKDPRTSHVNATGQIVPIDDYFYVGGKQTRAPRQFADDSENYNCGCGIEIIFR